MGEFGFAKASLLSGHKMANNNKNYNKYLIVPEIFHLITVFLGFPQ